MNGISHAKKCIKDNARYSSAMCPDGCGLVLPGWDCPRCGAFNGEALTVRFSCRACGYWKYARLPGRAVGAGLGSSGRGQHSSGTEVPSQSFDGPKQSANAAQSGPISASGTADESCPPTLRSVETSSLLAALSALAPSSSEEDG